jgi:hypothetical protein
MSKKQQVEVPVPMTLERVAVLITRLQTQITLINIAIDDVELRLHALETN